MGMLSKIQIYICTVSYYYAYLWSNIDLSLGHFQDPSWRRCPGRPWTRWLDQLLRESGTPPADLWRQAVMHGH